MATRGTGQADIKAIQQMLGLVPLEKPNPALENVVFISIDCEAYEFAPQKVTEIGVSILDMRDHNASSSSTLSQEQLFAKMGHIHLRPREYERLVNRKFVKGCPENFNFGVTKWVTLSMVKRILTRIFHDPAKLDEACGPDVDVEETKPNIVLVGHDLKNDSEYLRRFGFSPFNVSRRIDTQRLSRPSKRNQPGLKMLLSVLEIDATYLHNAGNDSAYTLQALVAIALKEHQAPGGIPAAITIATLQRHQERMELKERQRRNRPEEPEELHLYVSGS